MTRLVARPGVVGGVFDSADYIPVRRAPWRDPNPRYRPVDPNYLPFEFIVRGAMCCITPPVLWPVWWLGGWN